jgi:hypothetical protein
MEIEFRGKHIDEGDWIYGSLIIKEYSKEDTECCVFDPHDNVGVYYVVDPETIGQYTTKDIEGTKLFVGDIIEYDGDTYEIIFQEEEARFIGINYPTMITASSFCKAKKIGTKYDNRQS